LINILKAVKGSEYLHYQLKLICDSWSTIFDVLPPEADSSY